MYLWPYSYMVDPATDTFVIAIWDGSLGENIRTSGYNSGFVTDDGGGFSSFNRAVVQRVANILLFASTELSGQQELYGAMWDSANIGEGIWSTFDATGSTDALAYLGCY